jgi:Protein of unknown function (DUF3579)
MSLLALVDRHAATQQRQGTIALRSSLRRRKALWFERPFRTADICLFPAMTQEPRPRQFFIQGVTHAGKKFRPSDWAERLAGALSSFRPEGSAGGIAAHIGYSPLCVPRVVGGVKCVIVSEALREVEPMAWDFVMHFARDNDLPCVEACLLPE